MQKELDLFKGLFEPFINISILHIKKDITFLDNTLEEIAKLHEGKVNDIIFDDQKVLRLLAREYEYIILSNIFALSSNRKNFLLQSYRALENSANIIILEEIKNNNLEEIKQLLEECSFRAINNIDLFPNYHLITAKKMHMWGNGL